MSSGSSETLKKHRHNRPSGWTRHCVARLCAGCWISPTNRLLFIMFLFSFGLCGGGLASDEALFSYKGLRVPPLPANLKNMDGYLVNPDAPVEHAVSEVWSEKNKMWWLERLLGRDEKGSPNFEVVAVMAVPDIPKDYFFVKGYCKKNGVMIPEIIAAAKYDENKEELTEIYSAWYVDTVTETFRPYPRKGITCLNESYGL